MILLFVLNYKITNGNLSNYKSITEFIKNNSQLFKSIIDTVKDIIIAYLLKLVLKEITRLVASQKIKNLTEKANNKKAQILSLLGVPQETIKLITNKL
jgi:uroporphyrinogen-III decarboxylase